VVPGTPVADRRFSNGRALRPGWRLRWCPRVEHPLEVVGAEHDVDHRVLALVVVVELVVQLVRVPQPVLFDPASSRAAAKARASSVVNGAQGLTCRMKSSAGVRSAAAAGS
jgi:hypothetical protein